MTNDRTENIQVKAASGVWRVSADNAEEAIINYNKLSIHDQWTINEYTLTSLSDEPM